MNLKWLDIILTYECSGACAHCCYRAGPGANQTMTVAEVEDYLAEVAGQPLEGVLLFGGEPFLFYDLLRECIPLAAQLARVLVFTNGCWAADEDTARRLLGGLQEVGLNHILFSVDAFHQAHVPLERIAVGIAAARELGYAAIEVDNRCLGDPDEDNPFNRRTRADMARLAQMCDLSDVEVYEGPARMVGRAADTMASRRPAQARVPPECPLPDYLGGDLRAPNGVEIHPGGWANLCAGMALGNANDRPLSAILAEYDPDAHPIIGVLASDGPPGLLRMARERGYTPAAGYADGCHMCYEARRFLHPFYPDHLAPGRPYVAA